MLRFSRSFAFASFVSLAALAACSGNGSSNAPLSRPTASPTPSAATATPTATAAPSATAGPTATASAAPTATATAAPTATATATAQPQVILVGFTHAKTTDPTFGAIAFYSPNAGAAAIVTLAHGSQVVFTNDDSGAPHTGSGLGSSGFPATFDNTSGTTQSGTTIDGTLSWSTGTLAKGASSQVFTVGPPGDYYFGCAFHYNSSAMRDVLVSI